MDLVKITLLCSDPNHPINEYIELWEKSKASTLEVSIARRGSQLKGGDILFLISCSEIVSAADRAQYRFSLVLHASDLPKGRGWSPHIWEITQGADVVTLSMIEVEDSVDSGKIWRKMRFVVPKHALWDEINHLLFTSELEMIDYAIQNYGRVRPQVQVGIDQATYFPRRTPVDSQINANKSIAEQFDLIRVCDPNRFPAYFEHLGQRYTLKIEKYYEH